MGQSSISCHRKINWFSLRTVEGTVYNTSQSMSLTYHQKPWRGLDFFKPTWSTTSVADAMAEWSWPTTLNFGAVRVRISDILLELSLGPGSLYSKIVNTPPDPTIHPEVEWDADVRLDEELCMAERAFIVERRRAMRNPFAALMGVSESEVDERDLPTVAIAGSGGGES